MLKFLSVPLLMGSLVFIPVAHADSECDVVLHLGDSNTVGMKDDLKSAYEDAGFEAVIDATGGRSMHETMGGNPNAIDGAKDLRDSHDEACWVVAMGVNDAANIVVGSSMDAQERIESMMDVIGDEDRVLWPSVAVGEGAPQYYTPEGAESFNEALRDAEDEFDNLTVIDWEPESDWFSDGVHYTSKGYSELISTIVDAVEDTDSDDSKDDDKSTSSDDSKNSSKDSDEDESKGSSKEDSKKSSSKNSSSKDDLDDDLDEEELDEDEIKQVGYSSGIIQEESL